MTSNERALIKEVKEAIDWLCDDEPLEAWATLRVALKIIYGIEHGPDDGISESIKADAG